MPKLSSPLYSKANLWRAIRNKCLDCCLDSVSDIRECTVRGCPLLPYRMGNISARIKKEEDTEVHEPT